MAHLSVNQPKNHHVVRDSSYIVTDSGDSDPGRLPKDLSTKALAYVHEREDALRVILSDPAVEIDTNHLEGALRAIPMGRRNWLFCWSEVGPCHVGPLQSLLTTCRLHGITPCPYLVDVLQRIADHPAKKIIELTPRVWKERFAKAPLTSDLERDEAHDMDIEDLSIDELDALNERVVDGIRYLKRVQVFEAMQRFNIGARVRFHPGHHGTQTGRLTKFNQKSVTILGDDHRQWRVPPDIVASLSDGAHARGLLDFNPFAAQRHCAESRQPGMIANDPATRATGRP